MIVNSNNISTFSFTTFFKRYNVSIADMEYYISLIKKGENKKALSLFIEIGEVYYTYHTSPTAYHYIGSLGLDHARRNQSWYKYYIEDKQSPASLERKK